MLRTEPWLLLALLFRPQNAGAGWARRPGSGPSAGADGHVPASCAAALQRALDAHAHPFAPANDSLAELNVSGRGDDTEGVVVVWFISLVSPGAAPLARTNLELLHAPHDAFLLHTDPRADHAMRAELRASTVLAGAPNVHVMRTHHRVQPSTFSAVAPLLDALCAAVQRELAFDAFVALHEAELVAAPGASVRALLREMKGFSFVPLSARRVAARYPRACTELSAPSALDAYDLAIGCEGEGTLVGIGAAVAEAGGGAGVADGADDGGGGGGGGVVELGFLPDGSAATAAHAAHHGRAQRSGTGEHLSAEQAMLLLPPHTQPVLWADMPAPAAAEAEGGCSAVRRAAQPSPTSRAAGVVLSHELSAHIARAFGIGSAPLDDRPDGSGRIDEIVRALAHRPHADEALLPTIVAHAPDDVRPSVLNHHLRAHLSVAGVEEGCLERRGKPSAQCAANLTAAVEAAMRAPTRPAFIGPVPTATTGAAAHLRTTVLAAHARLIHAEAETCAAEGAAADAAGPAPPPPGETSPSSADADPAGTTDGQASASDEGAGAAGGAVDGGSGAGEGGEGGGGLVSGTGGAAAVQLLGELRIGGRTALAQRLQLPPVPALIAAEQPRVARPKGRRVPSAHLRPNALDTRPLALTVQNRAPYPALLFHLDARGAEHELQAVMAAQALTFEGSAGDAWRVRTFAGHLLAEMPPRARASPAAPDADGTSASMLTAVLNVSECALTRSPGSQP